MTTCFLQALMENEEIDLFTVSFTLFILYVIYRFYKFFTEVQQDKYRKLAGPDPLALRTGGLVYTGKELAFSNAELHQILLKHFPYYRHLDKPLKKHFLARLAAFISHKVFIIRHTEGYKEMPVLLGAAAVQITFGLPDFRLPFFRYIQVHPEAYFADKSFKVLAGNVYGNTITVAWSHFYHDFQLADGANVGLHEMAHALYFQHMEADVFSRC